MAAFLACGAAPGQGNQEETGAVMREFFLKFYFAGIRPSSW